MKNSLRFGALLFLLTACDKKLADEPSSTGSKSTAVGKSGDSNASKKASERQDGVEKVTEEPKEDEDRDIAEPVPQFDDPEAPVIEPAPPAPIQKQPTGLEDLNLSEDQQQKIDQWIAQKKDEGDIDPADLARHIESLLDEGQKEGFRNMIQASGRSFESGSE